MPIRFRRTFKIAPGVKVNVSKGGISTTVGPRGFHLTFGKRGVTQTVGIPGSGISETSYLSKNEPESEKKKEKESSEKEKEKESKEGSHERKRAPEHDEGEMGCFPWGCLLFMLIVLVLAYVAARAMGLLPPNYLSQLLQQFVAWVQKAGY